MKTIEKILIVIMVTCICVSPALVTATTFVPEEITGDRTQTVMKAGASVYLFYSRNGDKTVAPGINDILTVYHEDRCGTFNEVGKIRIRSFNGDNYLRAEVIDGMIRPGDTAKKARISYLIIPAAFVCK